MANLDFRKILQNTKLGAIEKPKPFPAGTYIATFTAWTAGPIGQQGNSAVFTDFKLVQPQEDVDTDALEEFGGLEKLRSKKISNSFFLTEDAMFRIKEFLIEAMEVPDMDDDTPLQEALEKAKGNNVVLVIKQSPVKDKNGQPKGDEMRSEIAQFLAVSALQG